MNTIGERLRLARKNARLSQAALAEASGVSQQMISKLEVGKAESTGDIVKLARACGVDADWLEDGDINNPPWLLTGQGPKRNGEPTPPSAAVYETPAEDRPEGTIPLPANHQAIPVVGTAQLGSNGYWAELEYPVGHGDGYVDFYSSDPNAYALRCKGDSMAPRIKDGEFVVVEPNATPHPGDEVMVKSEDGRVMIKELLYVRDGLVHLASVNEAHGRITIPVDQVAAMHLVAGIAKRVRWHPD